MIITPQTEIRLVKVPLSISNKNQITFANKEAQYNYFNNLPHLTMDGCTYQRKDNRIYYDGKFDDLIQYNYVMYQNEGFSNKWFYAFITDMTYINTEVTSIEIATDVFQTWQFDIIYKESFIEREMCSVSEDIAGNNLLPESLETGEYKVEGTAEIDDLEPWYVVAYAEDTFGFRYNGIYSGILFYVYSDTDALRGFLTQINLAGKTNFILNIFTVPKLAFYPLEQASHPIETDIKATPRPLTLVSTPNSLDGYIPRNQKLRTYPYMYIGFNPNGSNGKIYRYEDFANGIPQFNIISEINPNPTVCFIPQNYRGANGNSLSDIAQLTGYPLISWSSDVFNVWLAQNSEIINLQMQQEFDNTSLNQLQNIGQVAGSLGSLAKGEIGSGISQAGSGALNYYRTDLNWEYYQKLQMAQIEKQEKLPNTGNFGSSNATLLGYELFDKNIFTRYTIKYQFAERIDKYFDMYGYLTNKVKIPNINNRPNWNYVKTMGINLLGDIPQEDLALLKTYFDNGITLWHNPATFLDYSQNNR